MSIRQTYYFKIIDSTNSELHKLAENGAPHGTVVVTEYQSAGRGQPGRSWWMPAGKGVMLSVLIRELPAGIDVSGLSLHVGRHLAGLLQMLSGLKIEVKPPNDLLVDGKKVCGILCEARWRQDQLLYVIVGVGVNVKAVDFPEELRQTATSLEQAAGREFDLSSFTTAVMDSLRSM